MLLLTRRHISNSIIVARPIAAAPRDIGAGRGDGDPLATVRRSCAPGKMPGPERRCGPEFRLNNCKVGTKARSILFDSGEGWNAQEMTMLAKTMLAKGKLAVAAALMLGAISAAQAANDNQSRDRGGSDIGPLGQCFVPPDCGGRDYQGYQYRRGPYGFAYAPAHRYHHRREWRGER